MNIMADISKLEEQANLLMNNVSVCGNSHCNGYNPEKSKDYFERGAK